MKRDSGALRETACDVMAAQFKDTGIKEVLEIHEDVETKLCDR